MHTNCNLLIYENNYLFIGDFHIQLGNCVIKTHKGENEYICHILNRTTPLGVKSTNTQFYFSLQPYHTFLSKFHDKLNTIIQLASNELTIETIVNNNQINCFRHSYIFNIRFLSKVSLHCPLIVINISPFLTESVQLRL